MNQMLLFLVGFSEAESFDLKKILADYPIRECNKLEDIVSIFSETKFEQALLLIDVAILAESDLQSTDTLIRILKYLPLKVIGFVKESSQLLANKYKTLFDEIVNFSYEKDDLLNKILSHLEKFKQLKMFANGENINQIFHILFAQAPFGVTLTSGASVDANKEVIEYVNLKYEEIVGLSRSEIIGTNWTTYTHPEDLKEELKVHKKLIEGKIKSYSIEKRYVKKDGSISWANLIIALLNLKPHKYVCFVQDITAQKEAEISLKESERSKSSLLSHIPGMAYRCKFDADWTMEFVSLGCKELTGYQPEDLIGNKRLSYNKVIAPEYRDYIYAMWEHDVEKKVPFKYEYEIITLDGQRKWVYESGQAIYDEEGNAIALEGIILDIADRKQMEDELSYFFQHDTWTGLFNRKYFEQKLKRDLVISPKTKKAVLALNLSTLNQLSIRYGFSYSQEVLSRVVWMLKDLCLDNYQLYSIYENWLAVYVNDYDERAELEKLADGVLQTLTTVFSAEGIGWGIGVIEIDKNQNVEIESLFKNLLVTADKSLASFNREFEICYFDAKMINSLERENIITNEIIKFISDSNNKTIFLKYQPIINIKSGEVWAFEALARMEIEKLGSIGPLEFIQIAEKTKLIIPLGKKIIEMAFLFLKQMEAEKLPQVLISINISMIQLMSKDFVTFINETINKYAVKPSSIILEITETAVAPNYSDVNAILRELKEFGYHIALDDFGTGYSSLSLERQLHIDCIKIDKLFIDRLEVLTNEEAITGDIVSMAHKLGHCVIAEGVESTKQLHYLEDVGCDMAQGFLFSKAVAENEAIQILIERNKLKLLD